MRALQARMGWYLFLVTRSFECWVAGEVLCQFNIAAVTIWRQLVKRGLVSCFRTCKLLVCVSNVPEGQVMSGRGLLKSRRAKLSLTVFLLLLTAIAVVPILVYSEVDIDASSGRVRNQVRLGPIILGSSVRETEFSRFAVALNGPKRPESWRCVATTSLFQRTSPHYQYHEAVSALQYIMTVREQGLISEDDLRRIAAQVLDLLWQDRPHDAIRLALSAEATGAGSQKDAIPKSEH